MYRDRFTDITTQDAVPTRAGGRRIELLSAMRMQSFRLGLARVGQTLSRTLSAQGWVRRTFLQPAVRAVRATRLLLFPMHAWRLHDLNRRGRFLRDDPLMFLKREHYLSRFFGLRQRFDNVLLHYRHELDSFDETYRKRVYREDGLVLFEDQAGDMRVSMRLAASGEHRCEGEATVIAELNGEAACYVSYSFVDAACFGLPPGKTMFVTRSQLMPAVQLFRRCYPHSSPQYFCLAAIAGIALANRMDTIAVVKAEAQVCYQAVFDERFRNAYCNFWAPVRRAQHRSPSLPARCAAERAATGCRAVEAPHTGHRTAQALGKHHPAERSGGTGAPGGARRCPQRMGGGIVDCMRVDVRGPRDGTAVGRIRQLPRV